jgi:uronate dehydrogenase
MRPQTEENVFLQRMKDPPRFHRILLTGAAGGLGRVLRERLAGFCDVLRVSDREPLGAAREHEEVVECDLADRQAVHALVAGVDAIAHFGGISVESKFEPILQSNIVGVFNLYEAARKHGVKRIAFASSNHVTGFYRQSERIGLDAPVRPDGLYGVSKCFGENLSRFYYDRYGIETVCMRIGSSFALVKDRRMMHTFLAYDDLVELVRRALFAPNVGHAVIYGVSNNVGLWWDNAKAARLGFKARESSEPQRARVEAENPLPAPDDPARVYQGGNFTRDGPFDE